jgi:sodium-dependent phosphate cotransporter
MVAGGALSIEGAIPVIMGANIGTSGSFLTFWEANIGTTVTAMLASLATGNLAAVTVAFAHLFFNLAGILLVYPDPNGDGPWIGSSRR